MPNAVLDRYSERLLRVVFWKKEGGNTTGRNLDFRGNEELLETFQQWLNLSEISLKPDWTLGLVHRREEVTQEGTEWCCTWARGRMTSDHERLDSLCWKEVSHPTTRSPCARCPVPQIHMALGPVLTTVSHSAYPCLWGSCWIFPSPRKTASLLLHGKYSTKALKIQILSILPLLSHPFSQILDLKITRKISPFCGLFLWAGLLELFVSPLELCDFLICNHVSPDWIAWRRIFMLTNLCSGYLTAQGCHHQPHDRPLQTAKPFLINYPLWFFQRPTSGAGDATGLSWELTQSLWEIVTCLRVHRWQFLYKVQNPRGHDRELIGAGTLKYKHTFVAFVSSRLGAKQMTQVLT